MALRINHNVTAVNGHRWLVHNDGLLAKSLEKLSSGQRINRASDGPAALIISEQVRSQVASVKQAISNSEIGISMTQTAEAALTEVTNTLTSMRQLAISAANEGANDKNMLEATQLELRNSVETVDRITVQAQFGIRKLLDGTTGANGVGTGEGVSFIGALPSTRGSPIEGYEVRVFETGTRARLQGKVALSQEMIDKGEMVTIAEGGRTISFQATKGDTPEQFFGKPRSEMIAQGMELDMEVSKDNMLSFQHRQYGKKYGFEVSSSTAGFLSEQALTMQRATPGKDIRGTLGGQFAMGDGRTLTGGAGSRVEGLKVLYTGIKTTPEGAGPDAEAAGRVAVYQNSLQFQIGPNAGQHARVSLLNTNTRVLGRGVVNEAGFRSISELDIRNPIGAASALSLIERAVDEVNVTRANMGAFQKNAMEANLRQLRVNYAELMNSESVIRDADMAEEMVDFTRNNIMLQSSTAMLAHANNTNNVVLTLLKSGG
jgi:flagellin